MRAITIPEVFCINENMLGTVSYEILLRAIQTEARKKHSTPLLLTELGSRPSAKLSFLERRYLPQVDNGIASAVKLMSKSGQESHPETSTPSSAQHATIGPRQKCRGNSRVRVLCRREENVDDSVAKGGVAFRSQEPVARDAQILVALRSRGTLFTLHLVVQPRAMLTPQCDTMRCSGALTAVYRSGTGRRYLHTCETHFYHGICVEGGFGSRSD